MRKAYRIVRAVWCWYRPLISSGLSYTPESTLRGRLAELALSWFVFVLLPLVPLLMLYELAAAAVVGH